MLTMLTLIGCAFDRSQWHAPITSLDREKRVIVIGGRTVHVPPMFSMVNMLPNEPYTVIAQRQADGSLVATQIFSYPASKR